MISHAQAQADMDKLQLQTYLQKRQLLIWNKIVKLYEVEDSLNSQVHTWILKGKDMPKPKLNKKLKGS